MADSSSQQPSDDFHVGYVVILKGLTKAAHLNGRRGTIAEWKEEDGRWGVMLDAVNNAPKRLVAVRSSNMEKLIISSETTAIMEGAVYLTSTGSEMVTADGRSWFALKVARNLEAHQEMPSAVYFIQNGLLPAEPDDSVEILHVHLVDDGRLFCKNEYKVSSKTVTVRSDVVERICGGDSVAQLKNNPLLSASAYCWFAQVPSAEAAFKNIHVAFGVEEE